VTVEKVSLSLDPDLVAEARELSGRGGLSALVNDALRVRLQQLRIGRLLDEMDAEFGPVSDDVTGKVAAEWRERDQRAG
jgi:hypothetical protein